MHQFQALQQPIIGTYFLSKTLQDHMHHDELLRFMGEVDKAVDQSSSNGKIYSPKFVFGIKPANTGGLDIKMEMWNPKLDKPVATFDFQDSPSAYLTLKKRPWFDAKKEKHSNIKASTLQKIFGTLVNHLPHEIADRITSYASMVARMDYKAGASSYTYDIDLKEDGIHVVGFCNRNLSSVCFFPVVSQ